MECTLKNVTVDRYVSLLNPFFDLTNAEIYVLTEFIHLSMEKELSSDPSTPNPFSSSGKRRVADEMGIENHHNLNGYIKRLKDKGAIKLVEDKYQIHPLLYPQPLPNGIKINLKWDTVNDNA